MMPRDNHVTIEGNRFVARDGELLLDAAIRSGIDLAHDCRSGYCGTCRMRLLSGHMKGGEGSEPGIVHACQARIAGEATLEKYRAADARSIQGILTSVRALSGEVMEVGITLDGALPHHAGQFAQVRFLGYPSRPFSISYPVSSNQSKGAIWFHIRRMKGGRVTSALGKRILPGHRVELTGPFGSAHFQPNLAGRLILVATSTGFAPIWAVAIAALREKPDRMMMIIIGGRNLDALYMGPALVHLARFPNVLVLPVCSAPQTGIPVVRPGRPTDYLPRLVTTDVIYACGAPAMVDSIRSIATLVGATCHSDPFLPPRDPADAPGMLARAAGWLATAAKRPRAGAASRQSRIRRSSSMDAVAIPRQR